MNLKQTWFKILSVFLLVMMLAGGLASIGAYWVRSVGILPGSAIVFSANVTGIERSMAQVFDAIFGDAVALVDGVNDDVEIQAALDAGTGDVILRGGDFTVNATLDIGAKDHLILEKGSVIKANSDIDVIKLYREGALSGGEINVAGVASYSSAVITFDATSTAQSGNQTNNYIENVHLKSTTQQGTAILMKLAQGDSSTYQAIPEGATFKNIRISSFDYGFHIWGASTDGSQSSWINKVRVDGLDVWQTNYCLVIQNDNSTYNNLDNQIFTGLNLDGTLQEYGGIDCNSKENIFIGYVEPGSSVHPVRFGANGTKNWVQIDLQRGSFSQTTANSNFIVYQRGLTAADTRMAFDFGEANILGTRGSDGGIPFILEDLGVIAQDVLLGSHLGLDEATFIFPFLDGSGSNVSDISGNGENLQCDSSNWTTIGRFGGLYFNGTDEAARITDNLTIGGDLSLIFVIKPNFESDDTNTHVLFAATDGTDVLKIEQWGDDRITLYMDGTGSASTRNAYGSYPFDAGDILVIVAIKDETNNCHMIYVNGVRVGYIAGQGTVTATPLVNYVMRLSTTYWGGDLGFFTGVNYAFNNTEVIRITKKLAQMAGRDLVVPGDVVSITKNITHSDDIVDDGGATGHADFGTAIPAGSIIKSVKFDYLEAFNSDNTTTLTIMVGPQADLDAYNLTADPGENGFNTTTDAFWGESACQNPIVTTAATPRVTFTEDNDITHIISGAGAQGKITITITYMKA